MELTEAIAAVNAAVNKFDQEDCGACAAIEDLCPFHEGAVHGEQGLARILRHAIDDPESVTIPVAARR